MTDLKDKIEAITFKNTDFSLLGINGGTDAAEVKVKDNEHAFGFLEEAADIMRAKAQLRDTPNGERTAKKIAEVFNAITGHTLSEADAWMFLIVLKIVRSRAGKYNRDDYVDLAAYSGLLGEHESNSRK